MIPILGLLTIVVLAVVVVRIGGIALELTGLSADTASFQAQSAFSGAGFTTLASEAIMRHPLRRRIIRILILLVSVGITSTIATFILTFVGESDKSTVLRMSTLTIGLLVICPLARSTLIYDLMKRVIIRALSRIKTLTIHDYQEILGMDKGFTVS